MSRYSLSGRASSGLYRIEYQVADEPGGSKQLLLNEFPVRSSEELGALVFDPNPASLVKTMRFAPFARGPQTLTLLTGLKECRFEYYTPAVASQPGRWEPVWTSVIGELPRAMAIRITSSATGDADPVSIVAPIRNYSRVTQIQRPE